MKASIYFAIIALLALTSCVKQPSSNFTTDQENYEVQEQVIFTNISIDTETYFWDFGDDNTSTSASPTHTYQSYGEKTIKLTCFSKKEKKTSSFTKTINIYHPTELKLVVKNNSSEIQPNVAVSIYNSSFDYNDQKNAVATKSTDENGVVIFSLIDATRYYFGTTVGYLSPSDTENAINLHETSTFEVEYLSK